MHEPTINLFIKIKLINKFNNICIVLCPNYAPHCKFIIFEISPIQFFIQLCELQKIF